MGGRRRRRCGDDRVRRRHRRRRRGRRGAREREALRARFGPELAPPIAALLDPVASRVDLKAIETAALIAQTGLDDDAARVAYLGAARAQATYDNYDAALTDFKRWCAEAGEPFVAPAPLALVRYFTDRAGTYAFAVLRRALVAINVLHGALGIDVSATTGSWVVRQTLRGVANEHGRAPRRRARAFVVEYLRAAQPWYERAARVDPVRATRNFALLAVGLATDLRAHSLVSLRTEDVTFHEQGAKIVSRRSKTRRPNDPPHVIAVHRVPDSPICAVAALERYVRTARLTPGYLFRGVGADGTMRDSMMDTLTVTNIVRQGVRATGLDLDDRAFSSHSLRSGGITSAYERGADGDAIMKVSDHVDRGQMLAYVRPEDPFRSNHVALLFGEPG